MVVQISNKKRQERKKIIIQVLNKPGQVTQTYFEDKTMVNSQTVFPLVVFTPTHTAFSLEVITNITGELTFD